jgi:hypothetical protein
MAVSPNRWLCLIGKGQMCDFDTQARQVYSCHPAIGAGPKYALSTH